MTPPAAVLGQPRVLVFIVAYNAERTIREVVARIPGSLRRYHTEILIIDDSSRDDTYTHARRLESSGGSPFPLTVLFNPVNQGYGGNQKIGFWYAIEQGFDYVALVHGDGQYAPERLPDLLEPLVAGEADAVFGSRMMRRWDALRGGMPLYKYAGNRILSTLQNALLHSGLSEFHSGYRVYSTEALRRIPFDRNTNDFHFDTEIIIQLLRAGLRIREVPIPTYYGDEICHVNGLKYAWDVIRTTLVARAQDFGVLYDRKFDVWAPGSGPSPYEPKLEFESPHTLAIEHVQPGSAVLNVGCAGGHVAAALKRKGCRVVGIDQWRPPSPGDLDGFVQHDLNEGGLPVDAGEFDFVLLLDVIEHLRSPEEFVETLRRSRRESRPTIVIASTGNVAFVMTRLMLLLGYFNYGSRGILDLTHTRLFTFGTLRKLFVQAGYDVIETRGIPVPFPLAVGNATAARLLLGINKILIRVSRSLFAYQVFMVARPRPSLGTLLSRAFDRRSEDDAAGAECLVPEDEAC